MVSLLIHGLSLATRLVSHQNKSKRQEIMKQSPNLYPKKISLWLFILKLLTLSGDFSGLSETDLRKFKTIFLRSFLKTFRCGKKPWTCGAITWLTRASQRRRWLPSEWTCLRIHFQIGWIWRVICWRQRQVTWWSMTLALLWLASTTTLTSSRSMESLAIQDFSFGRALWRRWRALCQTAVSCCRQESCLSGLLEAISMLVSMRSSIQIKQGRFVIKTSESLLSKTFTKAHGESLQHCSVICDTTSISRHCQSLRIYMMWRQLAQNILLWQRTKSSSKSFAQSALCPSNPTWTRRMETSPQHPRSDIFLS